MKSASSPTLSKVLTGNLCAGCGACATIGNNSVTMQLSDEGFLRPVQNFPLSAAQEKTIAAVCPGLSLNLDIGSRPDHIMWGPTLGVYQGYSTDPEIRKLASSGGVLSSLLNFLLATKAVDRVVQVAADPEIPTGNRTVVSSNRIEVLAASGSRYAPSMPMGNLQPYLESELRYAFVGKPCDVAALQAMKAFDSRISLRFPYIFSFFCAGVPSMTGAKKVIAALGADDDDVVSFRYRGNGWPGYATAKLRDGSERKMNYTESWGNILSKHVQFRCKICPDGTGSFADIVCADAWEADKNGYPVFLERDGMSLVLSRSEKGEALISNAVSAGYLFISPFDSEKISRIQPGQTQKRRYAFARLAALVLLARPAPYYRGFHLFRNAIRAGFLANLRNFLGTARRIIKGNY